MTLILSDCIQTAEDEISTVQQDIMKRDGRTADLDLMQSSTDIDWTNLDVGRRAAWSATYRGRVDVHPCSRMYHQK